MGIVIGGTGLVLKPTSGLLECISKAVNGMGMGIMAWGDEVVRIPRTRIRSPRHYGMFTADPTGQLLPCANVCTLWIMAPIHAQERKGNKEHLPPFRCLYQGKLRLHRGFPGVSPTCFKGLWMAPSCL